MQKRLSYVIIIITAIALTGIIITQIFWVANALETKDNQLQENVGLGMKRVVNQLMSLQNDTALASRYMSSLTSSSFHSQFIRSLDPDLITQLITNEFQSLEILRTYDYGIYEGEDHTFIIISNEELKEQLINSPHQEPISCIFQTEHFYLAVYFPHEHLKIFNEMLLYILLSVLFMFIVIGGFWYVTRSLLLHKRLAEIRTDYVNNMTHELKTPIATISVASEMLLKPEVQARSEKIDHYAKIIYNENQRLRNQAEQVLQVAILERGEFKINPETVDVHQMIEQLAESMRVTIKSRNGVIQTRLNAADHIIQADKNHFTNVLSNLIENANKYSPDAPHIVISTHSTRKGIFISCEDKGIGIAEEYYKYIFKKFHRISTGDVHDVKGFGIGLFYVKTIVEAHAGSIQVRSKPGEGSNFIVFWPFHAPPDTALE
jgi:two-component system phosphate regulon sensor histidine kinase PhoR